MLISYKWLQSYFKEKLPEPEKLAETLTFLAFEVEGVENKNDDIILDLKVLPDRACYALSHRGIAGELSALLRLPIIKKNLPAIAIGKVRDVEFVIEDDNLCHRHIGRIVEGIKVEKSPEWLRERLESIGQRSINNIVDATNFATLDMGQPLHAFDADKVKGMVTVRPGRAGEVVITLDGKTIPVDSSIIVIADEEGPLDIAGIKGGKKAELDQNTKTILLSAANFDPASIRRASNKTGVKTDASKRFENNLSPERAKEGMDEITALISELCPKATIGKEIDVYPKRAESKTVRFSPDAIREMIGVSISDADIIDCLLRIGIRTEESKEEFIARIPFERNDLSIQADIAEEVGRLHGYDKISAILPPKISNKVEIPKSFYYEWKIREILVGAGFSEVMTSSFVDRGDMEILASAMGKNFLRSNLLGVFGPSLGGVELSDSNAGLLISMNLNKANLPLLGSDTVKIFEIGKVFIKNEEQNHLALAVWNKKGKKETLAEYNSVVENLIKALNLKGELSIIKEISGENFFEMDLERLININKLSEPKLWDVSILPSRAEKFQQFSPYPFIVRDIALFVPTGTESDSVHKLILSEAGPLVVRSQLFDKFEKDDKISYAFRLVFQSPDRTLSDSEINQIMSKITLVLNAKSGWKVR